MSDLEKYKEDPDGEHECPVCKTMVPNLRAVLVGTVLCGTCTPQPKKIYGVMEYSEKAVGVLIITDSEKEFKELKKPANKRR